MFTVTCPSARTRGAQGVFYGLSVTIAANNREEAENKWREQYESCAPLTITEQNDENRPRSETGN